MLMERVGIPLDTDGRALYNGPYFGETHKDTVAFEDVLPEGEEVTSVTLYDGVNV